MTSTPEHLRLAAREPALATARAALEGAAAGRGRLVLIAGEAGIGKTTMLAELAGVARRAGSRVLTGQCWDGDGAPPYWPWIQVLRALPAEAGGLGDAAVVLPEHAATAGVAGDPLDARFRLFDGVVRLLARSGAEQTTVVVLDDLHWADDASVRLLEFAARHVAAERVLLVGTYRDDEAGEDLRRLAVIGDRIPLLGLPREDVVALMAAVAGKQPPDEVAIDVWRRTGGNPFLVREVTRLLVAQGDYGSWADSSFERLDGVRDVLERRLARLSQPCAQLLQAAALCGPEVRTDLLHLLVPSEEVSALLEEAAAARVLAGGGGLERYRFAHDLFREAVVAGLPPDTRRRLHLQLGRALETRRDEGAVVHPAELAMQFCSAAAMAPAEAVRYAVLAGEEATARLAFEEAYAHYDRALAALELEPDPQLRLDLLVRLGEAGNRAGDTAAARAAFGDAVQAARTLDDPVGLARAAIGMHTLGWRSSHAQSIGVLEEAAAALPEEQGVLRARVLASLARDLYHSRREQDWERALVLAERAVSLAAEVDDPDTRAFCLLALHDAQWRPGSAPARLEVVEEMMAAAEAAGDRELEAQARLLRATALLELGDPTGVAELETYCRVAEQLGHARARWGALSRRATLALLAGRVDAVADLAAAALALGQSIGEPDALGVHETLLWACRRIGGSVPSLRLDSEPWPELRLAEAAVRLATGDVETARELVVQVRVADLPRRSDLELYAFFAEALAAVGTPDQRRQVYEQLLPFAGMHVVVGGCASYFGAVDHYLGMLARAFGDESAADRHFASAAVLHEKLGAEAWAARSSEELRPREQRGDAVFRRDGDVWTIVYAGRETHLADAKGLRDLAVLLSRPGEDVQALELHTGGRVATGADAVLDDEAKAAYRRRLGELDAEIDDADAAHDPHRKELAVAERDALVAELTAAVGLGRRDRRLGDERERARKAVAARIRDAIDRIDRADQQLGAHLRASIRTGTWCTYGPAEPVRWRC